MSRHCTSCGSSIPEGQGSSCSMCYGDIAHGRDGYYQQWAEERQGRYLTEIIGERTESDDSLLHIRPAIERQDRLQRAEGAVEGSKP